MTERDRPFGSVIAVLSTLDLRGTTGDPTASLPRPQVDGEEPVTVVRELIGAVRSGGDAALLELTRRFDGVALESLVVGADELSAARARVAPELRAALELAA